MKPIFDLQRIESETFVQDVEYRHSVASTNDLAMELARDETSRPPLLVLTEQQTCGRGRGSNRWWSADGALTFSLVIDTRDVVPATSPVPLVSLVTGLALCKALDGLTSTESIRLKWPNDLLAGRRKVAGILTEVPARPHDRMVIGIGINVNNSLAGAPRELQEQATSLTDLSNRRFDLSEILVLVLRQLHQQLADFAKGDLHLGQQSAPWCALRGKTVSLRMGSRRVVGVCQGIDNDGALIVSGDQTHRCLSGVVESIEWG